MSTEHAKNLDLMRAGYHVDSKKRIAALDAAIAALAATGKQQVGEVQGDRTQLVALIVRNCCESEPSHPDNPDTVCINVNDLEAIVSAQLEAVVMEDDPIPALAARQPVYDSPMAKMAAALRTKAADEQADFNRRVQSGEWGPMPDAGTQADFCKNCDGSGWDGQSRETVCPTCSGGGIAARQPVGHTIETARALGERTVASVKLIGTLADLPEHVQKVIQSYAGFCVRSALLHQGGQLPAALQEVEQKS